MQKLYIITVKVTGQTLHQFMQAGIIYCCNYVSILLIIIFSFLPSFLSFLSSIPNNSLWKNRHNIMESYLIIFIFSYNFSVDYYIADCNNNNHYKICSQCFELEKYTLLEQKNKLIIAH